MHYARHVHACMMQGMPMHALCKACQCMHYARHANACTCVCSPMCCLASGGAAAERCAPTWPVAVLPLHCPSRPQLPSPAVCGQRVRQAARAAACAHSMRAVHGVWKGLHALIGPGCKSGIKQGPEAPAAAWGQRVRSLAVLLPWSAYAPPCASVAHA